ncbi:hypothetical protein AC739_17745 [Planococcus glaciei]|nr:hypothetical protein AC739_17745 [Planococcus glaciei]
MRGYKVLKLAFQKNLSLPIKSYRKKKACKPGVGLIYAVITYFSRCKVSLHHIHLVPRFDGREDRGGSTSLWICRGHDFDKYRSRNAWSKDEHQVCSVDSGASNFGYSHQDLERNLLNRDMDIKGKEAAQAVSFPFMYSAERKKRF